MQIIFTVLVIASLTISAVDAFQFRRMKIVSPTKDTKWFTPAPQTFNYEVQVRLEAEDYEAMKDDSHHFPMEEFSLALYEEQTLADRFVHVVAYKSAEAIDGGTIRFISNEDGYSLFAIKFPFQAARVVDGEYYFKLQTSHWYGQRAEATSSDFKAFRTGAQNGVPTHDRVVQQVFFPKDKLRAAQMISATVVPLSQLKSSTKMRAVWQDAKTGKMLHEKQTTFQMHNTESVQFNVKLPKTVGQFVLTVFPNDMYKHDHVVFRSNVISTKPSLKRSRDTQDPASQPHNYYLSL